MQEVLYQRRNVYHYLSITWINYAPQFLRRTRQILKENNSGNQLKKDIARCKICKEALGFEPNPVTSFSKKSKIIIIGQAPGSVVHKSGIPWDDKSGDNLRAWMNITKESFYDEDQIAIVPMGFCYPGKGKSGDLPPRKECAPTWHNLILSYIENPSLTLLIGSYAQAHYLKDQTKITLTETVENYQEYLPNYFVLPHPSPRNNIWMKKNEWFKHLVIPELQKIIKDHLK